MPVTRQKSCCSSPSPHSCSIPLTPTLWKFTLLPLRFYERPILVPVFTNVKKSKKDFSFYWKKGEKWKSCSAFISQWTVTEAVYWSVNLHWTCIISTLYRSCFYPIISTIFFLGHGARCLASLWSLDTGPSLSVASGTQAAPQLAGAVGSQGNIKTSVDLV